jgi:hypothetical protein
LSDHAYIDVSVPSYILCTAPGAVRYIPVILPVQDNQSGFMQCIHDRHVMYIYAPHMQDAPGMILMHEIMMTRTCLACHATAVQTCADTCLERPATFYKDDQLNFLDPNPILGLQSDASRVLHHILGRAQQIPWADNGFGGFRIPPLM